MILRRRTGGYSPSTVASSAIPRCYPPKKMVDEVKANFQILMESYPSGQRLNNLLVAKNFSDRQDQIMVGNGAAELINIIMRGQKSRIGVVLSSCEEYVNKLDNDKAIVFSPNKEGFQYTIPRPKHILRQ